MATLLIRNKIKKNELSQISSSNKDILVKKHENKKGLIYHYDLHEKIILKKNLLLSNTSVKKIKQVKKISINDYENKPNDINISMNKNYSIKNKTKLDLSNKENHILNQKEKKDMIKNTQKKILNNIEDMKTKIKVNKKTNLILKNINSNATKLSKSDNISENDNINKKGILISNETSNNDTIVNTTTFFKNEESDDLLLNTLKSQDKKCILKNKTKHLSEHKIRMSDTGNFGNIIPLIQMRKKHIKYSMKRQNTNINIKNRKLIYKNGYLNISYLKKYNSSNNEINNNKSYIDVINNLDIINIINKKELTKKLSSSIQKDSILNHTQELSKKRSITKNLKNNKVINISTKLSQDGKELDKNNENNKLLIPLTMRSINLSNENYSLLNSDKKNNSNKSFLNNKWEKKYFIPIVSASLINGEDKKKINHKNYKKINKKDNSLTLLKKDIITNHNRKSLNFGDNNKKKREMLFNFINEKIEKEKNNYISFQTKRTNSLTLKRDKHITERKNSINIKNDNYYNLEDDLIQQEKKLELISNELSKEKINTKINKTNKFCISMDNICNKNSNNNIINEKIEQQNNKINNTKCKTFHIKINSLNNNHKNNNSMIIKRGDLLNKLRKIKHNYSLKKN